MSVVRFMLALAFVSGSILSTPSSQAQEEHARPADAEQTFKVFLLGNTGASSPDALAPTLDLLQAQLAAAGEQSAVVFLGDQLDDGMPDVGEPGRAEAEQRLMQLVDALRDYPGEVFVLPGDRDVRDGQDRAAALTRQEDFLEERLGRDQAFRPGTGNDGVDDVKLADDLRLVLLDTDGLLRDLRSLASGGAEEPIGVYTKLEEIMKDRSSDDVIAVGHHPILSNGTYSGHRPPYYLLPVVGTAAYAAARATGDEQHYAHRRNKWMRERLKSILNAHEDIVYVSAHDYSLQHFESERINRLNDFVVSGSAAKSSYVVDGHDPGGFVTRLASDEKGFVSIAYYTDGSIWLDAWGVRGGERIHEMMLRRPELPSALPDAVANASYPSYADSSITIAAGPQYDAWWLQRFALGSNRRDEWATEVEVPYLDMGMHGGLRPVKRGGSAQSTSIRLEAPDGKQYALRSVDKSLSRALPPKWQGTIVAAVSEDFTSYVHPYAALPVPPLADAVGVYHANPRLVYVPDDPRLGDYRDLVGGTLMIIEERPNSDHWADAESFGNPEDIIGWSEMYYNVTEDNDNRIDARLFARSRLFDFWLADWDRHKDQWRWTVSDDPDGDGEIYRPIPRDRDVAFNRLNFLMHDYYMAFYNSSYASFEKQYHLKALAKNGRSQDHRFLSSLDRGDWLEIADSVQAALTDEVIAEALRELPPEIYDLNGEDFLEIGRIRREKLPRMAEKFYLLHARSVDVVGTDKHERFEVTRADDGTTEVVMYKTSKEGEIRQELYRRTLRPDATREINLYGLGGNDRFVVEGNARRAIRLNIVGGADADTFVDESRAGGVHLYDSPAPNNTWQPGPRTRIHRSENPSDNTYSRGYEYEGIVPVALPGYNSDDGFLLSAGVTYTRHAFRKHPFAQKHRLSGGFASARTAYHASYSGTYSSVFKSWSLATQLSYRSPGNVTNFFGLGNETVRDDGTPKLFEEGLGQFTAALPMRRRYQTGISLEAGPTLRVDWIDEDRAGDLLGLDQPGLSDPAAGTQVFAGARTKVGLVYRDDANNPRRGYAWTSSVHGNLGVSDAADDYATVSSALSLYTSLPTAHQATLAVRVGGAHNVGTFPFYTASALGGTTNLRGFRSTRFSGRTSFYANVDLRLALFSVKWAALPGRVGVLGFVDHGRVWTDGESSDVWHRGYGGGIWYDIVDDLVLSFAYGISDEDTHIVAGLGFFF